jgi:hypothetical protein
MRLCEPHGWAGEGVVVELLGCEPEARHGRSRERVRKQVHSKASLRRAVNAVQRCGVACVRTGLWVWGSTASSLLWGAVAQVLSGRTGASAACATRRCW